MSKEEGDIEQQVDEEVAAAEETTTNKEDKGKIDTGEYWD